MSGWKDCFIQAVAGNAMIISRISCQVGKIDHGNSWLYTELKDYSLEFLFMQLYT
jgi:hypothetical protein